MPRLRQPPSLRKASIENIVCNFEDFWCAGSPSDLEHSEQPDVFTPFQYLSDHIIQEIIDMLQKRDLLRPHHFQLLLHSNIRALKLDLDNLKSNRSYITKTLGTRCQKLTHLEINMLLEAEGVLLCTLMRNLPEIVSLRLHHIQLLHTRSPDASVITATYENCPNLLELDLSNCKLSLRDVRCLYNYPKHPKLFSKLRKIVLEPRHNLSKGALAQLLKNHTHLQSIGTCHLIDHAFDKMYGEEFRSSKVVPLGWRHNLTEITIRSTSNQHGGLTLMEFDRLDLTLQCCPCLTKLTLYRLRVSQSLQHVAKLKHLKYLSVHLLNADYVDKNFSTYMATLLNKIGDNLTELKFVGLNEINLILIGKYCHNLESLEIWGEELVSDKYPIDDDVTHSFSHLTKLTYHMSDSTKGALSFMLKTASNLVHLECSFVEELTDKVISEANRKHGFRHLKKCSFDYCPISVRSMWMLLCPDNALESLSVSECSNITSEDINLVRNEAKLRQFHIDIYSK